MIFKGQLSEYESIAPLNIQRKGKSAFSNIYKASDKKTESIVILKTLHSRFAQDEGARERFINEARYELNHPFIVKYIDYGTEPAYFTISEYLSGKPLNEIKRRNFRNRREYTRYVINVFINLCNALTYIHEKGFVHCDIKPSNILATNGSKATDIKLIDFGQTYKIKGNNPPPARFSMIYSPPEILLRRYSICGPHSDIYSAGISMYELLTGNYPYRLCNSLMVINLQLNLPLPPNKNINKNLFEVLLKATNKIPFPRPPQKLNSQEIKEILTRGIENRYPNASDFSKALVECLNEL